MGKNRASEAPDAPLENTAGPDQSGFSQEAVPAAKEQEAKASSGLDEKRKTALLRYMGILFGVAFLLVLLSSLIQMRNSRLTISELNQASNSALQNAEALQTMNRELVDQNAALIAENTELEQQRDDAQELSDQRKAQMDELGNQLERVESLHQQQLEQLDKQLAAAKTLAKAQYAQANEDEEGFQTAMQQLKDLAEYLEEEGKAIYQSLLTEKQPD